MPAPQFQTVREDLFLGIDARSAENQVPPGFMRDALNADIVQGRARTRQGYAGYAGNFPVRPVTVEYKYIGAANPLNQVCFTLDSAVTATVDLISVRSSPLVTYGRLSANMGAGPFTTTDSAHYYTGFTQEIRQTFLTGTNTLNVASSTTGLASPNLFVNVAESLSPVVLDNQLIEYNTLTVNESTFDIALNYTNSTGSNKSVFVYYSDEATVPGDSYVNPAVTVPTGTSTITILAATHQLSNFNIVARVYRQSGSGTRQLVRPETLSINPLTGTVSVTIINHESSADYVVILAAAAPANFQQGSLSGSTYTITIDAPEQPFIFPGVYLNVDASTLEEVVPDQLSYDSALNQITLTFQTNGASAYTVYWLYGIIRSTEFCVYDSSVSASGTDTSPQLTVWGLDQTEIFGAARSGREGWANLVDSYRSSGENRVVGGQGGNLYSVREYSESGTAYKYGSEFTNLFNRTATTASLGPVFWGTSALPGRTRGYITGTALDDNWATCTAVSYDGAVAGGSVRYDLTIPALAMYTSSGSVESSINNIFTVGDILTAEDMSYSVHNGSFDIVQVSTAGSVVSVWVLNSTITAADWDDDGCAGTVGVFTDVLSLQTNSAFAAGDRLLSAALGTTLVVAVVGSDSTVPTKLTVAGITSSVTIQAGVRIVGQRTSPLFFTRSSLDTSTVVNYVRGDIVYYSPEPDRPLRILFINPGADITGSTIVGAGATATLTLGSGTTDAFMLGMRVFLTRAGVYDGEQVITNIPDSTSLEFSSTETATVTTAVVKGNSIEVGEAIEWADTINNTNTLTVDRRLIPVEAPDDSYVLTPATRAHYFDVNTLTTQPSIRSSMVQDNLYMTNSDDEVLKYDGDSIYRAGLINWQPGVFIQTDTAATAKIVLSHRSVAYGAIVAAAGRIELTSATRAADIAVFSAGDLVRLDGSTTTYTIQSVVVTTEATPKYYIYTDAALDTSVSATGTVSEATFFKYYYRLDAVDSNGNVTASAVAQSEDYSVELTQDAAIYHKLIGMPAWDNYDYDTLYVRSYRTKAGTSAPYYLAFQQRMPFNGADGYIEFTDTFSDSLLTDLDPVSTALKGQELGVGWQEPLRAASITAAANTVVLGNISDYPELSVQLFGVGTSPVTISGISGTTFTFRKDYTDTGTTTDMVNRVSYQFLDATGATTRKAVAGISGTVGVSFNTNVVAHGLAAGDWVYLYYGTASTPSLGNRPLTYTGWWQVRSVPDANHFVVAYTGSAAGAAAAFPDTMLKATTSSNVPVLLGDPTTHPDGNSSASTTNSDQALYQAARRLSLAINATMRMTDITLAPTFRPWIIARGGNDTGVAGKLLVRQPRSDVATFGIKLTTLGTTYSVFVNDVQRVQSDVVAAQQAIFPSRVLFGYPNYGEIFDNPTAVLDSESDSAIDVNPSDGQEVTCIVPFFGSAVFGAAQQSSVVVVFKENSIYLADINEKRAGRNPLHRIESEGVGCTAPASVSVTKNGIFFANEAGMYVLRQNQTIEYLGLRMERQWTRVDKSQLDLVQGHHYNTGRKYKLSVPISGDTEASEVFVYDHTNETAQYTGAYTPGTWTRYDNHPVTGWANLKEDAYFCSSTGRLFQIRNTGETHDYQDDYSAINFNIQTRANDFGLWGVRKIIQAIVVGYRALVPAFASVGTAVDTEREYISVTGANLENQGSKLSGVDDSTPRDVITVVHETSRRKGVSLSVQISNSTRLEVLEIAGIEFSVAATGGGKGVLQAANT